jgi:heat shock protein HtpX
MGAYGLQTHIWNNNLKSVLLLAGFPVLLLLLMYALNLGNVGLAYDIANVGDGMRLALANMNRTWPFAFLGAGLWFLIAWFSHQALVNLSTGARPVTRAEAPDLYNLLENLCISRGLSMPKLQIIETPALNAFASGVSEKNYAITLTRGIIETLDTPEIEAVMAHELTHIRNRDVRLLIIAVIFVGIFSFFGELVFRNMFRTGVRIGGRRSAARQRSRGGGALILIAVALIIVAYALAMVPQRRAVAGRCNVADAGAVDLTKNPDGMIAALKKISGRSAMDAPQEVRLMMLDNTANFSGLFATHPSIEKRIAALEAYAGGQS